MSSEEIKEPPKKKQFTSKYKFCTIEDSFDLTIVNASNELSILGLNRNLFKDFTFFSGLFNCSTEKHYTIGNKDNWSLIDIDLVLIGTIIKEFNEIPDNPSIKFDTFEHANDAARVCDYFGFPANEVIDANRNVTSYSLQQLKSASAAFINSFLFNIWDKKHDYFVLPLSVSSENSEKIKTMVVTKYGNIRILVNEDEFPLTSYQNIKKIGVILNRTDFLPQFIGAKRTQSAITHIFYELITHYISYGSNTSNIINTHMIYSDIISEIDNTKIKSILPILHRTQRSVFFKMNKFIHLNDSHFNIYLECLDKSLLEEKSKSTIPCETRQLVPLLIDFDLVDRFIVLRSKHETTYLHLKQIIEYSDDKEKTIDRMCQIIDIYEKNICKLKYFKNELPNYPQFDKYIDFSE